MQRSSGRVLGHVYAWMRFDCSGDAAAHLKHFPDYDARREARADLIAELSDAPAWEVFSEAERPPQADLDDDIGEPLELAKR